MSYFYARLMVEQLDNNINNELRRQLSNEGLALVFDRLTQSQSVSWIFVGPFSTASSVVVTVITFATDNVSRIGGQKESANVVKCFSMSYHNKDPLSWLLHPVCFALYALDSSLRVSRFRRRDLRCCKYQRLESQAIYFC